MLGIRTAESDEEASLLGPLSARSARRSVPGPLPERVSAVLAQRLVIETASWPSRLINLIKRTAAFEDPEFHRKQAMRLSIATTPRVISCAEARSTHIALPRGCWSNVAEIPGPPAPAP
jgi:hypothetical protein